MKGSIPFYWNSLSPFRLLELYLSDFVLLNSGYVIQFWMSGGSLKKEHSFKDQAELQNTEHTNKVESEFSRTLYSPVMEQVFTPSFEKLVKKLSISGIEYKKSQFWPVFSKSCIKTDWESTIYDAKFGNYRTQLKVVYFNLDSNSLFCNDLLGKGGFGQVIRFRTSTGEFALKNINCKKNKFKSVDTALQEIFMAKLLSALEVGPKFIPLFSYDAIVFNNCIQYAMEVCRTKFKKSQIEGQLKSSNQLLMQLKTLHSLNICHMDIKSDNIAWSPSLDRFVFLDFTFTKFIKEPIGCKTPTDFEGTLKYASPQMKKRWILQDKSPVDLYYNDLFCLENVRKQFQATLKKSDTIPEFHQALCKDEQSERLTFNSAIVRYFKLKMSFFVKNIAQAIALVQKQVCLVKTFRKILRRYQEKNGREKDICTFFIPNGKPSLQKEAQIDKILLRYELEMQQNPLLVTLLEIIKDDSKSLFQKAWQEDNYKQKMFFFVDVYSNPVQQNQNLRKCLVNKIYCQIASAQTETYYTMKFRKVIEYYGIYFCKKKKNLEVVEKIMSYFVLMNDRQTRKQLEENVLTILEQEENYLEYSERNFKYFMAEIITINSMVTWDLERHIQNSQNLIKKLSKKMSPTDSLMLELSETLQLMKLIKNYRIGNTFNKIDLTEEFGEITSLLNKKDQEIRKFIHQVLLFKNDIQLSAITIVKQSVFKDHYLQKCAFYLLIVNCTLKSQVYSLRMMAESDEFLSKFTVLNPLGLDTFIKSQKQKRVEIRENYFKADQDSGWGLRCQCISVLEQFYDKVYNDNYKLDWPRDLKKLCDVRNLEKLYNLKGVSQIVTFYFLNAKFYRNDQKISLEKEKKVGEVILQFLEYTSNIIRMMQEKAVYSNQPQLKKCIYFKQAVVKQMRVNDWCTKGMALLLMHRVEQATAIALEIADDTIECQQNLGNFLGFISYIWEYRQQNCQEQANKITLKLHPHLMKGQFRENLLQYYNCLRNLLRAFKSNGMIEDAFNCIGELCCYAESNNINITNTNLFLSIKLFLPTLQQEEIKYFVQTRIKWQLSEFTCCPALTYILYKASQHFPHIQLNQTQRKRLVVVLVMFIRKLSHGFFADYRHILYQDSFSLKKRKIRTLSELRRLALQNTFAAFTETFTSARKGKHKSLFSREAMEQMAENTNRRAQYYYLNCKCKIKPTD